MKVWGDSRSGNCFKSRHVCAELGVDYEWQEVDILAGETRNADFLAMSPNGRIPLVHGRQQLHPRGHRAVCLYTRR